MKSVLHLAAAAVVALGLAAGGAQAAGGGDDDPPKNKDLVRAAALVDKGSYAEALPLLARAVAAEPKNADAYNYLGYSHRKLGDTEAALGFYRKALEIKPTHLGANEYLGELYLELGDLKKAEERLAVLDTACFFGCDEYSDLKEAIKAYKKRNGG
ncbi:MAG: tetratricopeptide repeat protein [Rhodospirillales bacterium]|nr:tetratricopeptide repeat protein [Rhodospirillales bacterium]MDH3792238.1 tetratricopeptide repeat protein [Rhodospirillales bacterium]MDH3911061.1 tetratricopeptide repeat protein [Rhodospirillales bacterium]MDH3920402.1 tetratricopeptide repeat protein [Rhodospirillales bacterium]MDH3968783.1 tetratricopeptide repeat protein [Rhodospirillales bacterium]